MAEEMRNVSIEPQHRVFSPETSWDDISELGAYVEFGTGDLYRIPKEALLKGSSPLIRKESMGASRLVQISKDPFITTLEARIRCAENNIHPNFQGISTLFLHLTFPVPKRILRLAATETGEPRIMYMSKDLSWTDEIFYQAGNQVHRHCARTTDLSTKLRQIRFDGFHPGARDVVLLSSKSLTCETIDWAPGF